MKKNPLSGEVVWLGGDGDLRFGTPAPDEVMTFEERRMPPQLDDPFMEDTVARFHLGADEQFFLSVPEDKTNLANRFGKEIMVEEDEEEEAPLIDELEDFDMTIEEADQDEGERRMMAPIPVVPVDEGERRMMARR